jgi:hypothetical protein
MPAILFRDPRFVVLDKPAGLKVHAGPGGGESVEDLFPALSRRKDGPWLAHRLDADTAGCLVIALRRAALLAAQAEFAAGRAHKTYWAVVRGVPAKARGVVDAPLLRRSTPGGWRMAVDAAGQAAVTEWRLCMAGIASAHRADASGAGALRGAGLPGAGRSGLWRRCRCPAFAGAGDTAGGGAASGRYGAAAGAYAWGFAAVWVVMIPR